MNQSKEVIGLLPFRGGGECPVQYEVTYCGDEYYIRYRFGWLSIDKNDISIFGQLVAHESSFDGSWSGEDTQVYLELISNAIQDDNIEALVLPTVFMNYKASLDSSVGKHDYLLEKRKEVWSRLKPIFQSWQIGLAGFLGGPLAVGYCIHENFIFFDQKDLAKRYWWTCLSIAILIGIFLFFASDTFLEHISLLYIPPIFLLTGYLLATISQNGAIDSYMNFGGRKSRI